MNTQIKEIAERIKGLREILEISEKDMAECTKISEDEYKEYEEGNKDFSFTFLNTCADKFGIDIVELLTGENPHLSFFTVTRKDHGVSIGRRSGFKYQHMAHNLKGKLCEPFVVKAPYVEEDQDKEISLSSHEGQEFDIILKGSLKVRMEEHELILSEGDAIMYDSSHGHGMIATGGKECTFLAVVMKK